MIQLDADLWVGHVHKVEINSLGVRVNETLTVDPDYLEEFCSSVNLRYAEVLGRLKRWQNESEKPSFSSRSSRSSASEIGG